MKHKLLSYVVIVSAVLMCTAVTPQALAENTRGKAGKSSTNKGYNQPGQLQTTGTPGSPDDTTTIDGKQLPVPPQKFGGKIERNAAQSKPYWPARITPPKDAPNVLLIITDDTGYGTPATFGGVVPTPNLDRVAANGLRYTNFHSTALCSPTRAALITGRNHHSVSSDTLTGVDDKDYQSPFAFTGKIDKITLTIDRPKLSPDDIKKLEQAQRDNKTSE